MGLFQSKPTKQTTKQTIKPLPEDCSIEDLNNYLQRFINIANHKNINDIEKITQIIKNTDWKRYSNTMSLSQEEIQAFCNSFTISNPEVIESTLYPEVYPEAKAIPSAPPIYTFEEVSKQGV